MLSLKDVDGNTLKDCELDDCNTVSRLDLIAGSVSKPHDGEISRICARFEELSDARCSTLVMESLNMNPIEVTFPNGHVTIMVAGDKLPIPKETEVRFGNRKVIIDYEFQQASIFSQNTDDGDETEREDEVDRSRDMGPTQSQAY